MSPRRHVIQRLLAGTAIIALGACSLQAFRTWRAAADESEALALAQSSDQAALGYVAAALRWRPDDADLWRERATFSAFSQPRRARAYAERALRLNPQDWRAWQALGLLDLQLGDLEASRRDLRAATRYDHGFDSHFALANLALVQGNESEFTREITAALAVAPLDRVSAALRELLAFRRLSPAQLAGILPASRAEVMARAIELLASNGKLQAATDTWRRLRCQPYQFAECQAAVLILSNVLVAHAFADTGAQPGGRSAQEPVSPMEPKQMVAAAMAAWNEAVQDRFLPQSPVHVGMVNDDQFAHAWVGPAFAWQSTSTLQTVAGPPRRGNAVRIGFDGYEPDYAVLLQQWVPAAPGATYAVSYRSRRPVPGVETGLSLQVFAGPNRRLAVVPAALQAEWLLNSATIQVPRDAYVLQLVFTYSRPIGQVRLHDPVLVADVTLQALNP